MPKARKPAPEAAPRDREATEKRFIEAAARVIARDGAGGLGVNAIAAEAGADKKLIYRYFGGLDGLLEAMGSTTGLWLGNNMPETTGDYGQRIAQVFAAYAANLRQDPVLQQLLAWELAQPSDTLRRIDAARSKAMFAIMPRLRGDEKPPEGIDAPALNAALLAALHYLVLRGATMGAFSGLPLKTEADWKRVMAVFEKLLATAYEPAQKPG